MPSVISSLLSAEFHCSQQFALELPPRAGEGRPRGGVALICRRCTGRSFRTIDCNDARICGVIISCEGKPMLNIIGCYMPYWNSSGGNVEEYATVISKLDAIISSLRPSAPVILVGDFNCALSPLPAELRPSVWHRLQGFTPHSAMMQDLLDDNDLVVAEFHYSQDVSYTYARGGCQSHIDHIAIPQRVMSNVQGCTILPPDQDNLSPHLPLICTMTVSAPPCAAPSVPAGHVKVQPDVLVWSCAEKLHAYNITLEELLANHLTTCGDSLDELDATITRCIHIAARSAGCAKPRRRPKSWWTPVVAAERDRARFWRRLWQQCGQPAAAAVSNCYYAARRAYRRARRAAATAHIEKEASLLRTLRRDRNLNGFWRRVQRVRRGGSPPGLELGSSDFRAHFQAIHQDSYDQLNPEQRRICDAVEARVAANRGNICTRTVSADQVAGLLSRLERGKAPGVDGVTSEHLVHGRSPALLAALARLLSHCLSTCCVPASFADSAVVPLLKKSTLDPNCMDNYRPIAITTCASKLLELLVLDELKSSFKPHDLQFGFISKRGSAQASLIIGETVQFHRRRGLSVFSANLDARKCFDRIWHDGLFNRLAEHLSVNSWLMVVSWYRRLSAHVIFGGITSEQFYIHRGTRQGAILSPTLANIFLYPLLQTLDNSGCGAFLHGHHVPAVCYADDLLLLSTNARNLAALLRIVGSFAEMWRLEFVHPEPSKTKSHCIVFGSELLAHTPTWTLSGQTLQVRLQTEHLGVVSNSRLSAAPHVEQRTKRARGAFYGLTPVGMLSNRLSAADKIYLWKTVVVPTLIFGCETAPLTPSDVECLDARQAACIKAALGLPRTSHHTALLTALNVSPIHESLRGSIFKCFRATFHSTHRLNQIYISGLAQLAVNSDALAGSFLSQVYAMCNKDIGVILDMAAGRIDHERIQAPRSPSGLVDSIKYALSAPQCQAARRLLRLLTSM